MAIIINIDKAKDITKDRLRQERKPILESLDIEVMRNITNAEKLAEIETKKQLLRDITNQVNDMTTIDELKSASLPVLE